MKKLILLILLLPSLCFGGSIQDAYKAVIARKNAVGNDYTADANCMGAWYMNANTGNETDRSGEDGTLTDGGSTPTSATVPTGFSGTSRDFELGDPDYLSHADAGSTDISGENAQVSLVAWIKPEAVIDTQEYDIVGKYDYVVAKEDGQYLLAIIGTDTDEYKFICYVSYTDGVLYHAVESDTTNYTVASGWHHVACVIDDTDMRIYVDGELDCEVSGSCTAHTEGIFDGDAAFSIGCDFNNDTASDFFDGLIDEVGVFNDALTAAEVLEIKNYGIDGTKGRSD